MPLISTVLLNDFRRQWSEAGSSVLEAVERVGRSGWYILGREVAAFEEALASEWTLPHAVGVASGLDALEVGLRALGVGAGDRVLTTPLSAFATTLAVVRTGAVPVFVDVDGAGLLDLELCRDLLARDGAIKAILPVHLYGHALDLDRLAALRAEFGVTVLEDCAQSIGARWGGRLAGTVGEAAATSFYPTKNLGALGDGGALLTASSAVAERARALRNYGQTATYVHDHLGLNSRLDELHAAILGRVFLPRLAEWGRRRAATARRYLAGIAHPDITVPRAAEGSESVWHLFPVLPSPGRREELVRHLRERGVQTGAHYPRLIPHQKALAVSAFEVAGRLPNARRFAESEVSLPIHPFLTDDEVERVIAACNSWGPR